MIVVVEFSERTVVKVETDETIEETVKVLVVVAVSVPWEPEKVTNDVRVMTDVDVEVTGGGFRVETGVVVPLAKAWPDTVVVFQMVEMLEVLLPRP